MIHLHVIAHKAKIFLLLFDSVIVIIFNEGLRK